MTLNSSTFIPLTKMLTSAVTSIFFRRFKAVDMNFNILKFNLVKTAFKIPIIYRNMTKKLQGKI